MHFKKKFCYKQWYSFLKETKIIDTQEAFLRPLLNYYDNIYDKPYKKMLMDTVESIQYIATLAIRP